MINRDYLPYKSAREYTDRGMAKWMGFFISEHSTALSKEEDSLPFSVMNENEKLLFLTQAFLFKKNILLSTTLRKEAYKGIICDLTGEKIYLKTENNILTFTLPQILRLILYEETHE